MKRFMFLSIGVLCLAIAVLIGFYVGSQKAEAQSSTQCYGFTTTRTTSTDRLYVLFPDGRVYTNKVLDTGWPHFAGSTQYCGNLYEGVVATDESTWGTVKGQYNK